MRYNTPPIRDVCRIRPPARSRASVSMAPQVEQQSIPTMKLDPIVKRLFINIFNIAALTTGASMVALVVAVGVSNIRNNARELNRAQPTTQPTAQAETRQELKDRTIRESNAFRAEWEKMTPFERKLRADQSYRETLELKARELNAEAARIRSYKP